MHLPSIEEAEVHIPEAAEWVDHGAIFPAGSQGDWDLYLWGGFTATAVRHSEEYLLYYQGSSDYRGDFDETVCYRSIGLAHGDPESGFQKFGAAPVLTWLPNNGCEEGAAAGAAVSFDGKVLLYYGANTLTGRTTVSADVRLTESSDGRSFRDAGIVLGHDDKSVWGNGDELFPLLALTWGGRVLLYYVPNGTLSGRRLGVAQGGAPDRLNETRQVRDSRGGSVRVWGPMGHGRVGANLVALFLKDGPNADMEVRLVDPAEPQRISEPVRTYTFENMSQATVVLDEERQVWLMFYRGDEFYGLRSASVRRNSDVAPLVEESQ